MNALHDTLPHLRLRRPDALAPRLFFSVFNGPHEIAHAHLRARASGWQGAGGQWRETSPEISYDLKVIQVADRYRNQGVGSALLDEVVQFCRDARVSAIYGQAQGDVTALRRWYQASGFQVSGQDQLRMDLGSGN